MHHPVFHWIWKVSHDWESVADLIPKMRSHLRRHNPYAGKVSSASSTSSLYDEESYSDSTVLFREGYCVAASDLAEHIHGSLDNLGALYDQVVGTGLLPSHRKGMLPHNGASTTSSAVFEKGQLLFFTRQLKPDEADHFSSAGFRFAPFNRVEAIIAKSTQIPTDALNVQMARLREFARRTSSPPPPKQGVYLVCLAALARVRSSFLVLVQNNRQDELPDVQLSPEQLTPYQMDYLRNYDGWTAERFVKMIEWKDRNRRTLPNEEKDFVMLLRNALAELAETLGEEWFFDLQFGAQPTYMRYGATKAQSSARTAVYGFTRLLDIHHCGLKKPERLALVNWDFVKLRQLYYPGCNDHGKMRHEVHAEFGPLITKHSADPRLSDARRRSVVKALANKRGFLRRTHSVGSHNSSLFKTDTCSERELVTSEEYAMSETDVAPTGPTQLWGGILATTDTVIVETSKAHGTMEMKHMGPQVTATAATQAKEPRSYVDVLYAQAKSHTMQVPKALPSS